MSEINESDEVYEEIQVEDTSASGPDTSTAPITPPVKKLTGKEQLFVIEYSRCGDPRKAAIECGVPEAKAKRQAMLWLHDRRFRHVADACAVAFEEKRKDAKVDSNRIVEELGRIAFFNPKKILNEDGELLPLHEMPDECAAAIRKFRVSHRMGEDQEGNPVRVQVTEIEFWNKPEALKQLGQHLGLLKDTVNITNYLSLDWNSILGRRDPRNFSDSLEARIAEVQPLALPGDVLQISPSVAQAMEEAVEVVNEDV